MSKELFRVSVNSGKYTLIVDEKYNAKALRHGEAWPAYDVIEIQSIAKHLASGLNEARDAITSSRDFMIEFFGTNIESYPEPVLKAFNIMNEQVAEISNE